MTEILLVLFQCSVQSSISKSHPGKIVALELCPINHNLILIGYEKGIVVLWDFEHGLPTKNFPASIQDCQQVCEVSICIQYSWSLGGVAQDTPCRLIKESKSACILPIGREGKGQPCLFFGITKWLPGSR